MSDIEHDLPDITVNIIPDIQYLTDITPSEVYQVNVNVGDVFSVDINDPNIIVANPSASVYDMAQLAGYALYAGSAISSSHAVSASYVIGEAGVTDWSEITNIPAGIVSQSSQVQLNQITGTTFQNTNFTFPQNLTVGGTLNAQTLQVSASTLYSSGSTKFGDGADDVHQFTGSLEVTENIWVTPGVVNELTASYAIQAENIGVIDAGIYVTGSESALTPLLGITRVTSASYAVTASHVSELVLASTPPTTPRQGSVYFSGTFLYIYDGTQYKSASLN